MSEEALSVWQEHITHQLGYIKKHPAIAEDLFDTYEQVLFMQEGEDIALGVTSHRDQFIEQVRLWITADLAHDVPVQRAFALPDNTIGYEYIPGEVQVVFEEVYGDTNCRTTMIREQQIWLCVDGDVAVVATNRRLFPYIAAAHRLGMWQVVLSEEYATLLSQNITNIRAVGDSGQATVEIRVR